MSVARGHPVGVEEHRRMRRVLVGQHARWPSPRFVGSAMLLSMLRLSFIATKLALLLGTAILLSGCQWKKATYDVVVQNPATGEVIVCQSDAGTFMPSVRQMMQADACTRACFRHGFLTINPVEGKPYAYQWEAASS